MSSQPRLNDDRSFQTRALISALATLTFLIALAIPALAQPAPPNQKVVAATPKRPAAALTIPSISAIASGNGYSCALTSTGGEQCWGWNPSGELGNGTFNNSILPADVSGLSSGVASIAAGGYHACAVTTSGGAECWGGNISGDLGDGTLASSAVPVGVSGLSHGASAITAGYNDTCALTTSGGAKCWGYNAYGGIGDGTNTASSVPVGVSGLSSGVSVIGAGSLFACALTTSGGVKCWGYNAYGSLGNGTNVDSNVPVDVSGLTSGVTAIGVGQGAVCAVTTAGGVKCWGWNGWGELGNGTNTDSNVPVDVVGLSSGVSKVSAGGFQTCAQLTTGGVKCWGNDGSGQLGDGTTTNSNVPVDVVGLSSGVAAISAGWGHTCALNAGARVECWGDNTNGGLGTGSYASSDIPTYVVWFGSTLTFAAAPLTLGPGATSTTLSGDLGLDGYGTLLGRTIDITRTNPDSTTTSLSTPTDATGHYKLVDSISTQGSYTYAATWAPDIDHGPPGVVQVTVVVSRDPSTLTLTPSASAVPYKHKVTMSVHLDSTSYAQVAHHTVEVLATPFGKSTVVDEVPLDSAGNGSIVVTLSRNTSFEASYSGDDFATPGVSTTVAVGVTIKVADPASAFFRISPSGYHLYVYTTNCHKHHKGCPTFILKTSPSQAGLLIAVEIQYQVHRTWYAGGIGTVRLNSKGRLKLILVYSSKGVMNIKERLRAVFQSTAYAASPGPWTRFEVNLG